MGIVLTYTIIAMCMTHKYSNTLCPYLMYLIYMTDSFSNTLTFTGVRGVYVVTPAP